MCGEVVLSVGECRVESGREAAEDGIAEEVGGAWEGLLERQIRRRNGYDISEAEGQRGGKGVGRGDRADESGHGLLGGGGVASDAGEDFSGGGVFVESSFAGEAEVAAAEQEGESDGLGDVIETGDEGGTKSGGESGGDSAGGATVADGSNVAGGGLLEEIGPVSEGGFELSDLIGGCALLRGERRSGATRTEERVFDVAKQRNGSREWPVRGLNAIDARKHSGAGALVDFGSGVAQELPAQGLKCARAAVNGGGTANAE